MVDPYFHRQIVSREMVKILQTTGLLEGQPGVKEKASKAGVPQVQWLKPCGSQLLCLCWV